MTLICIEWGGPRRWSQKDEWLKAALTSGQACRRWPRGLRTMWPAVRVLGSFSGCWLQRWQQPSFLHTGRSSNRSLPLKQQRSVVAPEPDLCMCCFFGCGVCALKFVCEVYIMCLCHRVHTKMPMGSNGFCDPYFELHSVLLFFFFFFLKSLSRILPTSAVWHNHHNPKCNKQKHWAKINFGFINLLLLTDGGEQSGSKRCWLHTRCQMYSSLRLYWYDSLSVNSHIHFLLLSPPVSWMRPLKQSSLLMAWLWWSSREIDFSRWSGIAWHSMWHLCEQALQLIIFWLLPFIQSYLYITKKYWMKERVKCFGYVRLQTCRLMVVLTVFGWLLVQFLLPYLIFALTSELLQLLL